MHGHFCSSDFEFMQQPCSSIHILIFLGSLSVKGLPIGTAEENAYGNLAVTNGAKLRIKDYLSSRGTMIKNTTDVTTCFLVCYYNLITHERDHHKILVVQEHSSEPQLSCPGRGVATFIRYGALLNNAGQTNITLISSLTYGRSLTLQPGRECRSFPV